MRQPIGSERTDFLLVDIDEHYYEAEDAFTRYAARYVPSDKQARWVSTDDGKRRLLIGGRLLRYIIDPTFDPVARPGTLQAYFRGETTSAADSYGELVPISPEYRERDARLKSMEAQGLGTICLFPTLGVVAEHVMGRDIETVYGNLSAFNDWLDDDWGLARDERILSAPLISTLDPAMALAEVRRVIERGARIVNMRPGPGGGNRSLGHPDYEPLWWTLEDAGVAVAFHASDDSYLEAYTGRWGEVANPPSHLISPFQNVLVNGRAVYETMAALVLHGVFTRHPRLRVASIEQGSEWVAPLEYALKKLGKTQKGVRELGSAPWDLFTEHVWVSPHPEEDALALAALIGDDHVLFGSDWPHAEGTDSPAAYLEGLGNASDSQIRAIMRDNARRFLQLT